MKVVFVITASGTEFSEKEKRGKLQSELDEVINKYKGISEYDCVVAFSGGKDSSYTLKYLVEVKKLNCLAVTIDNGFISEQAVINCKTVTEKLEVDHIFYTPSFSFMKKMYSESVTQKGIHSNAAAKRASNICNSCINLINTYVLKVALQNNIPIVAGGYISGQVPKDSAVMNIDLNFQAKSREVSVGRYKQFWGNLSVKYFSILESLIKGYKFDGKVAVINPMLAIAVTEDEIIDDIKKLGWAKTKDTGQNSSNCLLNDLGIYVHLKQYKFHPYIFEISEQVRAGLITREKALEKVNNTPKAIDLSNQAEKININLNDV
jgi:tRNA(Ile)-lysidine synthase TilS/MesJ